MIDALQRVRSLVPASALPGLVERRIDKLWEDPAFRDTQLRQMTFLLGASERAGESPQLARSFAEQSMLRAWMRWHPRAITEQRVEGIEWLTTRRDPERSTVLSFMHHHRFEGMFASLKRVGADLTVLALAEAMTSEAPAYLRQHMRVVARGATVLPTGGGTDAVVAAMRPGVTMAIASDVPGRTEVEFLGRKVLGSFGAARIATVTNSPVVLGRVVRDADGHHLKVDPPLEPGDFASPKDLLDEMLRRHGEAVLAWPEAVDSPLARWGSLD